MRGGAHTPTDWADPLERATGKLIQALVRAIVAHREGGELIDPVLQGPLPLQYQHAWGALACHLAMQLDIGFDETELELARNALWKGILDQVPSARFEFQTLAAAATLTHPGPRGVPTLLSDRLVEFIRKPRYLSRRRSSDASNNFLFLQGLTRHLVGMALNEPAERHEGLQIMKYCASRHQDEEGVFWDSPEVPAETAGGCCPLTYHSKMTSLALLGGQVTGDTELVASGEAGAGVIGSLSGMAGEIGWHGRSSLALFGDACTIAAAVLIPHSPSGIRMAAFEACERLLRSLTADGIIPITPSGLWESEGGWDRYMHLWDYETFAAGWLAIALLNRPDAWTWSAERAPLGASFFRTSGLASIRDGRRTLGIAARGSVETAQAPLFCDPRSLGGQVGIWQADGIHLVGPPPVPTVKDPYDLAAAGAVPFFYKEGNTCGPRRYEGIHLRSNAGGILAEGKGPCVSITPRQRYLAAAFRRTGMARKAVQVREDPSRVEWTLWGNPSGWAEFWKVRSPAPRTWHFPIPRILLEAQHRVEYGLAEVIAGDDGALLLRPVPTPKPIERTGSSAGPFLWANGEIQTGEATVVRWAHLVEAPGTLKPIGDGIEVHIGAGHWTWRP